MILEFKLQQNYSDKDGNKQDILKFSLEKSKEANDVSVEFIKHGNYDSHDVVFMNNEDIDNLIWFIQTIKEKSKP